MPLHDHCQEPLSNTAPWPGLHTIWAGAITTHLNQKSLPTGYYAIPHIHIGPDLQVDVAALEDEQHVAASNGDSEDGGVATAVWASPAPPLILKTDLADLDVAEIKVLERKGFRLAAAVELISPANKDSPESRTAFVSKIASYLQQHVGVVIIDVITERPQNLHNALLDLLDLAEDEKALLTSDLYAAAYRAVGKRKRARLEVWPIVLGIGSPLPVLPLWIDVDQAIPLDLETTYMTAFNGMRHK